jgi:ribosomal protein L40E
MPKPFFTTKADEMSRAFDAGNTDALPPGPNPSGGGDAASPLDDTILPIRRTAAQQAVCPFCGTVNEGNAKACRQCGMENTPVTRQATRGKIGPWCVWQQRNPSAPGMNWVTLIALVEKGRITPRSVVRGPTTGQLWRFAARVKGLSREFGVCWHCGAELSRTARLCSSCKRLQQPPMDPDVLLETAESTLPMSRRMDVPTRHRSVSDLGADPVRREVPRVAAEQDRPIHRAIAAATFQSSPGEVSSDPAITVVDMDDQALPSGLEMRTFEMNHSSRGRGGILRGMLIAALFAGAALAVGAYFTPQGRSYYERWYRQAADWVKPAGGGKPASSESPVIKPPPIVQKKVSATPTPLWTVATTKPIVSVVTAPPVVEIVTTPAANNGATQPMAKAAAGPVKLNVEITPPPPSAVASLPQEPQAAERRSWELYERAIKSEQREDYAGAVKEYEWIEQLRLPEGAGPTDVESRLARARQLLGQKPQ